MDVADVANDYAEKVLQAALEEHQYKLNQVGNDWPYGIGRCKNCGESIDDGRPYCDKNCSEDHWYRIKSEARNRKYLG